jgi:hypothetical protein
MTLPPEVIHTIDDLMRGDLQYLRDKYFDWLLYSTYLVIVGVFLEGPEVVHDAIELFCKSDRVKKTPKWIKFVALVGWLFVVLGVAGEAYFDAKVSDGDTQIQAFNTSLLIEAQRESADAESRAANAILFAGEASNSAKKATDSARQSESLARGARLEADTFERRLASAEHKADEAESHLAEAVRRAREATAALDRIRLPRLLTHIPELAATLTPFKGMEYTFAGVFADDESMQLLKQIDGLLQLAEWKRQKKTAATLGIPAFTISGVNDVVNMDSRIGILIVVDSSETVEALQALSIDKLPSLVRTALLLNDGIFSNLSPAEDTKDKNAVAIESGTSKVIRIVVGRKP